MQPKQNPGGDDADLRPFRRLLPIGFQSGYKTRIAATIGEIDAMVDKNVRV